MTGNPSEATITRNRISAGLGAAIAILIGCQGSGEDAGPAPETLRIQSLSAMGAMPTELLTVTGSGIDPAGGPTVRFSNAAGFKIDIPALKAKPTSLIVPIPPLLSPPGGAFGSGLVQVQVMQKTGAGTSTSNAMADFQIKELPALAGKPGLVTVVVLNDIIRHYAKLETDLAGTSLDVAALKSALDKNVAHLKSLVSHIQSIIDNPAVPAASLGSIQGVELTLDTVALRESDQLLIALFRTLSTTAALDAELAKPSAQASSVSTPCQKESESYTNYLMKYDGKARDTSAYGHYAGCADGGLPVAVKITNWVVAGTGTLATTILALAGAPEIALALPAAALFQATTMGLMTQISIGAALKNVDSAAGYKAMHQAVDQVEGLARDAIAGKILPKTLGTLKDIYGGLTDLSQAFLNTAAIIPIPTLPTCVYTYTVWTDCDKDNTQTRAVLSSSPAGCTGTPTVKQTCIFVPPTCAYTYSSWAPCQAGNTQNRTVVSSSPDGCSGTPSLTQSCVYTPPSTDCCDCNFDVECTIFGAGGCWRCRNSTLVNEVCQAPQGHLTKPGTCKCEAGLYQVCE